MRLTGIVLFVLAIALPAFADDSDLLIADFEGDNYGDWKATGEAFGSGPARGTLANQMHVDGFEGRGLVNSFFKGDATTGTLTSPEFTVERKFLNFLIGGGKHENQTCINLRIDGKVVRTATGPNDRPGGTERLDWQAWDVAEYNGKKATLQIVDNATGGWGHINVDHILQSNTRRGSSLTSRKLEIEKDYLLLPVKNGAARRRVTLRVDGAAVRDFEIELAEQQPDFIVSADVRAFRGKPLVIESMLPFGSKALDTIEASNALPGAAETNPRRPQFHFTSRRGWLNDPNGLVYFAGEWHLFYQHNPYGWDWGNMHWGHAVSGDLLHWKELPTAIYPRQWGDWAFSGSAVVDTRNTSGFKSGEEPPLIAAYTSTGRGECIAFSNDRGRTWTDYEKNPVVKHAGRDPKVIWHEPTSRWVMAVYDESPNVERGIAFYNSPDLKEWTFSSRIEGFFECPDLFPLPVDNSELRQWVLYGADGKYLIGDFDGKAFHSQGPRHQIWYGNFYAAQTFSDVPDGRRILIGWANGVTFPGQPFNQQMTLPVELTLRTTPDGVRMFAWPVKEVVAAQNGQGLATILSIDRLQVPAAAARNILTGGGQLDLFDITCEWELQQAEKVTLIVAGTPITYDVKGGKLTCRNASAPVAAKNGRLPLRIVGDRGSLEIFANHGATAISVGYTPSETDRTLQVQSEGGTATIHQPSIGLMK
jgi:fructan beta-fructosidase